MANYVTIDSPVQSSEDWRFGLDFSRRMPTGATIASIASITVRKESDGTDVTSSIYTASSEQIESGATSVSARFANFADGITYVATFKVVLSTGEKREGDLRMPCLET